MNIKDEHHIISIITNFGCHNLCPYCIVKNANIKIPETTINSLDGLQEKIINSGNGLISISGGGDPLFNYEKHTDFYDKLFEILTYLGCKLELHTSYLHSNFPFQKCYRVVYHLISVNDYMIIKNIKKHGNEIVRIVFVVEDGYTENDIDKIYEEYKKNTNINELSFRQMVYYDYTVNNNLKDYLAEGHKNKKWYYIKQGDYNEYFVDGNVKNKFSELK